MKGLFTLVFSVISMALFAQPNSGSYSDCNGNSRDIHTVLGSGKALIIAHKGVDCSICRSTAPSLETQANQNSSKVEVWAAMTYRYNPASFTPACTATANWVNQYNWNTVFAFPDNNRLWASSVGSPRYYVYSPKDSSLVWQGSSQSAAFTRALQESTVSIDEIPMADPIVIGAYYGNIGVRNIPNTVTSIRVIDLSGRVIRELDGISTNEVFLNDFKNGVYIVQLEENGSFNYAKKVAVY